MCLGSETGRQRSGPVTRSAAARIRPDATSRTAVSISGARKRSGPGAGISARSSATTAAVAGAGVRCRRSWIPRAAVRTSIASDAREGVDRAPQLAPRRPAHRDVVLLHRRARDRVDRGGDGEPLELGDEGGLRVLGDHVARVDAGVVREEGRQPVAARGVEEAVGAALGDARDVRRDDGEEVEDVARAARRGSCRWTPRARRAGRPGCRSRTRARAPRRRRRGRACRARRP